MHGDNTREYKLKIASNILEKDKFFLVVVDSLCLRWIYSSAAASVDKINSVNDKLDRYWIT